MLGHAALISGATRSMQSLQQAHCSDVDEESRLLAWEAKVIRQTEEARVQQAAAQQRLQRRGCDKTNISWTVLTMPNLPKERAANVERLRRLIPTVRVFTGCPGDDNRTLQFLRDRGVRLGRCWFRTCDRRKPVIHRGKLGHWCSKIALEEFIWRCTDCDCTCYSNTYDRRRIL